MWLFLVEAYLFVLIAFTLGVVVGLVGVRFGVRRLAPPPAPKPKKPQGSKDSKKGRRGGKDSESAAAESGAPTGGAS